MNILNIGADKVNVAKASAFGQARNAVKMQGLSPSDDHYHSEVVYSTNMILDGKGINPIEDYQTGAQVAREEAGRRRSRFALLFADTVSIAFLVANLGFPGALKELSNRNLLGLNPNFPIQTATWTVTPTMLPVLPDPTMTPIAQSTLVSSEVIPVQSATPEITTNPTYSNEALEANLKGVTTILEFQKRVLSKDTINDFQPEIISDCDEFPGLKIYNPLLDYIKNPDRYKDSSILVTDFPEGILDKLGKQNLTKQEFYELLNFIVTNHLLGGELDIYTGQNTLTIPLINTKTGQTMNYVMDADQYSETGSVNMLNSSQETLRISLETMSGKSAEALIIPAWEVDLSVTNDAIN